MRAGSVRWLRFLRPYTGGAPVLRSASLPTDHVCGLAAAIGLCCRKRDGGRSAGIAGMIRRCAAGSPPPDAARRRPARLLKRHPSRPSRRGFAERSRGSKNTASSSRARTAVFRAARRHDEAEIARVLEICAKILERGRTFNGTPGRRPAADGGGTDLFLERRGDRSPRIASRGSRPAPRRRRAASTS